MGWCIIEETVTVRRPTPQKRPEDESGATLFAALFWLVIICMLIGACSQ